jgi:hypothetical protein
VSIRVERGTLKLRQTAALLAPLFKAWVTCSTCSWLKAGGLPLAFTP